jgi:outer membrane protein OmpA-like peptidoglycan-associated protein
MAELLGKRARSTVPGRVPWKSEGEIMRARLRAVLVCALAVAALAMLPGSGANAAPVKNHPAVSPYPGSVATRRDDDGHKAYKLVVGVDPKGTTDETALKTITAEGNLTRLAYENPDGKSAHEIFTNYKEGLQAGGYQILFSCVAEACGPGFASSRWARVTGLKYFSPDMRYLSAKHSGGKQEIYVAILVAKLRHQIEVLEVAEMKRGLVTAQALGEGLLVNGRAVLDGILFDTDKSVIKPESKPALDVIAKFLKDNPALNVFIVGHTDRVGAFDHNMALSRGRAAAVVKALIDGYGIAPARLSGHGVGPLSPAKSNKDEGGRTQNRRVEMVER